MSGRPSVPRNTERMLWSESIGHCMNPECHDELIVNGTSNGEMAHIIEHADGGDVSFENLLLLCKKCHTMTGTGRDRTDETIPTLRAWKSNRNSEIMARFETRFSSFVDLKKAVVPILERNGAIFESYGPDEFDSLSSERNKLWRRFESELVSNNRRLELILTRNRHLFHNENLEIIGSYVTHAREFAETRDDNQVARIKLFPKELLSIFGISAVTEKPPPSLSALQNFISALITSRNFIQLQLDEAPLLMYHDDDEGREVVLYLDDRPRVQQIFWNGRYFRPQTTEMRIENLVFFANWLYRTGIQYEFPKLPDLTLLLLNGEHRVVVCYKYVLSLSDVHSMALLEEDVVVNLHNWNGAPISDDAQRYARSIGVRLFSPDEFYRFAHRNIR